MPAELNAATFIPRYHDLYRVASGEPGKVSSLMRGAEFQTDVPVVASRFRETQETAVKEEKWRMGVELRNHEDMMRLKQKAYPASLDNCTALEKEKPRVFSPLEDSRRLLEKHDREIDMQRYNHPNHATDRLSKFPAYKSSMEGLRFDQLAAEIKTTQPRTSEYMFADNRDMGLGAPSVMYDDRLGARKGDMKAYMRHGVTVRGPYTIAPPKTDNRSMLRDTILSMGEYGEERSNRAVYPYVGKYAYSGKGN